MSQVSHVSRVFADANKQLGPAWYDYEQLVIEWVSRPRETAGRAGGAKAEAGLELMVNLNGSRARKTSTRLRGNWEGER
jgi:hypothetical protein